MSNNELAIKEAIRSMVDAIRQDPEYQAWAENVIRQNTAEQHFDAIRNGTFKPDTTRAEPRSVEIAEKFLNKGVTNDDA